MNERETLEVGATPSVRVELVEGDLFINGMDQETIEAVATNHGRVRLEQDGELVMLTADRGARVTLPRAARLEVADVRGDLRVRGLDADLTIDRVRGDADLTHVAGVNVNKVGGDLKGRDIRGDLALQSAGGDVRLRHVKGSLIASLGGDLTVKDAGVPLDVTAGGDAVLQIEIPGSDPVSVVAGGDITCRLKGALSAAITMAAGGDRRVDLPGATQDDALPGRITLGDGVADVSLRAGGDIWLGGSETSVGVEDPGAIGSRVAESVGKTLAEVEAGLAAMGAVMESVPEAEISSKVQRIVERAIRRRQRGRGKVLGAWPLSTGPVAESVAASDEERMKVLKMVESGKLSVEDAEKLFEALEV